MQIAHIATKLVHVLAFACIITLVALVFIGLDALFDEAPTRAALLRDASIAFLAGAWLGVFSVSVGMRHRRWLCALALAGAGGLVAWVFFNLSHGETAALVLACAVVGFTAEWWLRRA